MQVLSQLSSPKQQFHSSLQSPLPTGSKANQAVFTFTPTNQMQKPPLALASSQSKTKKNYTLKKHLLGVSSTINRADIINQREDFDEENGIISKS